MGAASRSPCGDAPPRYLGFMISQRQSEPNVYTVPEGCPVCSADLPVKVSAAGPNAVCRHCGWIGKPQLTVTHKGLKLTFPMGQA